MLLKGSKKVFPLPTWRNSYAERGQSKQVAVCCLFNPTLFAFQKQGGKYHMSLPNSTHWGLSVNLSFNVQVFLCRKPSNLGYATAEDRATVCPKPGPPRPNAKCSGEFPGSYCLRACSLPAENSSKAGSSQVPENTGGFDILFSLK